MHVTKGGVGLSLYKGEGHNFLKYMSIFQYFEKGYGLDIS